MARMGADGICCKLASAGTEAADVKCAVPGAPPDSWVQRGPGLATTLFRLAQHDGARPWVAALHSERSTHAMWRHITGCEAMLLAAAPGCRSWRSSWFAEAAQQPHDWRVHAPARCRAPREVQVREGRFHLPTVQVKYIMTLGGITSVKQFQAMQVWMYGSPDREFHSCCL